MMRGVLNCISKPRLVAFLVFLSLVAGMESARVRGGDFPVLPVLAVDDVPSGLPGGDLQRVFDPALLAWYKGIGTAVGVLLAFFASWYLVYPWALRRGRLWPVTLFGWSTATAWVVSWAIGLWVYWDDLPIMPRDTFWEGWGLRLLCAGMAGSFGLLCLIYWRSEAQSRAS